jgi:DhnA family fructose-bisphosphate aldolase class Ia
MMHNQQPIFIPADVPEKKHDLFTKNYASITRHTGRLFMFSCDQKIEHLNNDFYGPDINPQALHPEHFFRIAAGGNIGAMATHLGLIARYAKQYPDINYIVKLNATTNLVQSEQQDPISRLLWTVEDVINFKNNNKVLIPGVGITIYLGSEYESEHLAQAAQVIAHAHAEGLVVIAWVYPRGKAVSHENNPNLIAGAAGVAVSLGADFAKVKAPTNTEILTSASTLKIACAAAGNTKIVCSGGKKIEATEYLEELYNQIHVGDAAGTATGRNIFQRSLSEGIALTHAISALVYDNVDLKTSIALFNEECTKRS